MVPVNRVILSQVCKNLPSKTLTFLDTLKTTQFPGISSCLRPRLCFCRFGFSGQEKSRKMEKEYPLLALRKNSPGFIVRARFDGETVDLGDQMNNRKETFMLLSTKEDIDCDEMQRSLSEYPIYLRTSLAQGILLRQFETVKLWSKQSGN